MKAIVFAQTGGPEVLTQADVPRPEARAGWVLIKNHAIGVNFADTRFRQGTYTVKPKLPDTPGMEVAGVIEAVGDGVTKSGPACAWPPSRNREAAYAEYASPTAFMAIRSPTRLSFVDGAAFLIQVLTRVPRAPHDGYDRPGKSVLVHAAAGGIGLAAVQLAKVASARTCSAPCRGDAKAALAKEAGADAVINYVKNKFADGSCG
jgi:NADPH2:quinone reductase